MYNLRKRRYPETTEGIPVWLMYLGGVSGRQTRRLGVWFRGRSQVAARTDVKVVIVV